MYIWKGSAFSLDDEDSEEYFNYIKLKFFSKEDIDRVEVIEELPLEESDEFMNLLS